MQQLNNHDWPPKGFPQNAYYATPSTQQASDIEPPKTKKTLGIVAIVVTLVGAIFAVGFGIFADTIVMNFSGSLALFIFELIFWAVAWFIFLIASFTAILPGFILSIISIGFKSRQSKSALVMSIIALCLNIATLATRVTLFIVFAPIFT